MNAPLVYVSADVDGLESRTMAQCCLWLTGQSELARVLNSGQDSHLLMASNMLGISYDEAVARHAEEKKQRGAAFDFFKGRAPDASGRLIPEPLQDSEASVRAGECVPCPVDDARQCGKVFNFGAPGGLGAEKLVLFARKSYGVTLTIDQAKALKKTWLRTFPEFVKWFEYFSKNTETFRSYYSNRIRSGMHYAAACNNPFQSLGSDSTGNVLFLLSEACYTETPCRACKGAGCAWCKGTGISALFGTRLVNYVHDDWMLEAREEIAHEVAFELLRIIEEGMAPYLPDVPPTAKPIVSRFWSKDAKQVWIADANAPPVKGKEGKRLVAWPKAA
jgi:hypothetical protein